VAIGGSGADGEVRSAVIGAQVRLLGSWVGPVQLRHPALEREIGACDTSTEGLEEARGPL